MPVRRGAPGLTLRAAVTPAALRPGEKVWRRPATAPDAPAPLRGHPALGHPAATDSIARNRGTAARSDPHRVAVATPVPRAPRPKVVTAVLATGWPVTGDPATAGREPANRALRTSAGGATGREDALTGRRRVVQRTGHHGPVSASRHGSAVKPGIAMARKNVAVGGSPNPLPATGGSRPAAGRVVTARSAGPRTPAGIGGASGASRPPAGCGQLAEAGRTPVESDGAIVLNQAPVESDGAIVLNQAPAESVRAIGVSRAPAGAGGVSQVAVRAGRPAGAALLPAGAGGVRVLAEPGVLTSSIVRAGATRTTRRPAALGRPGLPSRPFRPTPTRGCWIRRCVPS